MSNWKSDYLAEAGVPRWVRRQTPDDATLQEASPQKPTPQKEMESKLVAGTHQAETEAASDTQSQPQLAVTVLIEHSKPQFMIVLPQDSELLLIKPLWQQLQKAWKNWTGDEFAASCYRLDDSSQLELAEIAETVSKTILAGVDASIDNSIKAEPLTLDSAINKRQWWTSLQTLLKSVRH